MNGNLAAVDQDRRAAVAIDDIDSAKRDWHRRNRRPSALSAREALAALQFEALVVWVAAHNIANGKPLTAGDLARLTLACGRIDSIVDEVLG